MPTNATPTVNEFDPFDPETIENPYPFFAALRREAPLYELPNGAYWLVSRYEDCRKVALDTDTFSSQMVGVMIGESGATPRLLPLSDGIGTNVLAIADPPEHTRQRKLANRAFAPRRVAALESDVHELTDELLDGVLTADEVSTDAMAHFAVPLPMMIICRLIGLPHEDRHALQALSDDAIALVDGINTAEQLERCAHSAGKLSLYLSQQLERVIENPPENVLGTLASAVTDSNESLTQDEAVAILLQLVTAGQETTGSLIGSAIMLLARNPKLQAQLRAAPSTTPALIEEVLRLESPFYGHFRQATRDTTIADQPVSAGARLMVLWASANRDDTAFRNADEIDLERPNPKNHFAFGHGIHLCIGAELARMEAKIAIGRLLARTKSITLDNPRPPHLRSLFVRRLTELPVTLSR